MAFRIASSPYTHNRRSTGNIMLLVVLAAVPGFAAQWYFFGYGSVLQVLLAVLTAWLAEAAILRLRKAPIAPSLADNSALLTAVLIGISLPPLAPWWLVVIGTLFAIVIAKQLYGGLGQNPFNPAMVGYVVLLISFPVQMTSWLPPDALQAVKPGLLDSLSMIFTGHTLAGDTMQQLQLGVDGVSQATLYCSRQLYLRSRRQCAGAAAGAADLYRRVGRARLAVDQSRLSGRRPVPAVEKRHSLAYSGGDAAVAGVLRHAGLADLPGEP